MTLLAAYTVIHYAYFNEIHLTLKKAGGSHVPAAQEIACLFSQDHARILKLLDFFKNDVGPRVNF